MYSGRLKPLALMVALFALAACGTTPPIADGGVVPNDNGAAGTATTTGVQPGTTFTGDPLDDPNSLLATRTVYFDFDSAELKGPDRDVMEAHARYLQQNPNVQLTLEGHADERGTREYNIALGERRANQAREFMTALGASAQQVRTISYGEERTAAKGHSEDAWRLNRRVEIVY